MSDKAPQPAINPSILSLLSPEFRAIVVELDSLPLAERPAAFDRWLSTRPDADEIRKAVAAVDPDGPPLLPGLKGWQGN